MSISTLHDITRYSNSAADFNEDTFEAIYYLGRCCYELAKLKIDDNYYVEALKKYEILFRKPDFFSKFDKEVTELVSECQNLIDNRIALDEIKCRATYCIGVFQYNKKNYEKAINFFEEYLHMLNYISDRTTINYTTIKTLHYKSKSHFDLFQYEEAINTLFSQLLQIQTAGLAKGSYYTLYNIAFYYYRIGEYRNALLYYSECLLHLGNRLAQKLDQFDLDLITINEANFKYFQRQTLRNIGLAYKKIGDLEKAKSIYTNLKKELESTISQIKEKSSESESEKQKEVGKNKDLYYSIKNNLAMTYAETGEFQKALQEIRFIDDYVDKK